MLLDSNNPETLDTKYHVNSKPKRAKVCEKISSSVVGKWQVSGSKPVSTKVGRSAPPDPDILPPCRVCDMAATGFHYGANTCEACKGFFRRSLSVSGNYLCAGNGECQFGKGFKARTWCAYCRFKKCLAVGMSREGIRTGRYTHAKRAKYITELRSLREDSERQVKQEDMPSWIELQSQCRGASDETTPQKISSRLPLLHNKTEVESVRLENRLYTKYNDDDKLTERPNVKLDIGDQSNGCDEYDLLAPVRSCANNRIGVEIKAGRATEVESLTATITNGYKHYNTYWKYFADEHKLRERQGKYWEERQTQDELFGKLKFLTKTEYYDFYNKTGIDIDGRGRIMRECLDGHEVMMKRRMEFMTETEIFHHIPREDLVNLLAGNTFEMVIFALYKTLDPDMEVGIHTNGELFTMDQFLPFIYDFMKTMCGMTRRLERLNLTIEEIALLEMICVLSTDRARVYEPAKIEALQLTMISSLRHQLKSMRPNPDQTFYRIWDTVIALRDISDKYKEYVTKCLEEFPEFEESPIVKEFLQLIIGID